MKLNIYIRFSVICSFTLCGFFVQAQNLVEETKKDTVKKSGKVQIAYGESSKEAITYSISTVNAKDIIKNTVFSSGNALFGKLPGLTVLQRTSEPGSDEPSLYLRGRSTTKTNSPLVIVDGIQRNINDVQLEDIESVSVLKDAASSIMYGIRGANGVVLVTTKRGYTGKLNINGKVEQSFMTPVRTPQFIGSTDYVKLYNQALVNDGFAPLYTQQQIESYENGNSYFYPNVDWNKEVTKDYAPATKANFDVTGGDKIANYYVSLGYFHQGGIYKNTDRNEGYSTNIGMDNVSFRSNLDLNVNKNWSFSLDMNGKVSQKNSPSTSSATTFDLVYKYPSHLFPVYVQDGVYGGTAIYPNNPVGYVNSRGYRRLNKSVIFSTLSTKYDFSNLIKGLSTGLRYSTDNIYSNQEGYTLKFAVKELLGEDASGDPVLSPAIGSSGDLIPFGPSSDAQNRRNTFEGNIQYNPELGLNHILKTQLVYHQDRLIVNTASPNAYQFLSGRVNYGYKNRYFVEAGASYSGTEAFPKGHRFGFFPALSAAWDISKEDFLLNDKSINSLKFRVSAGAVGNSEVGERFSDMRQYIADDGYYFGSANALQSGLYAGVIANHNFTWETAYKYDVGIDTRLFNHIDMSLTYFFQKRKNILVSGTALVPGIFGSELPNLNAGITHNTGFEGSLSYSKQKATWGFHAGLNISYATDNVQYFPEAAQPYDYLYLTGNRIGQPFMLESLGFFDSVADIERSPVQTFGPVQPGDIKYKDQNSDGLIDDFDRIPLKNSTLPSWDAGFDLGFNIKNFEINAFLHGQAGRSVYLGSEPLLFWPLTNEGGRISTYSKQYWTEQNKNSADFPRLTTQENKNNYRPSSFWYVNGNFLRLRSLDIAYNLPKLTIQNFKLRNAKIFLRGMNLFTLDHLKYTDPEVLSGYPLMKSYNVGINLQF